MIRYLTNLRVFIILKVSNFAEKTLEGKIGEAFSDSAQYVLTRQRVWKLLNSLFLLFFLFFFSHYNDVFSID